MYGHIASVSRFGRTDLTIGSHRAPDVDRTIREVHIIPLQAE